MFARYLIGRNPLERELIYNDVKRALRKHDRMGIGPVDIALWDIAGKLYNAPVWQLLGGWKTSLPAYASTYHGDDNGGLDSPEAFADFAVQCRDMGYPAFKIHGWGRGPIARESATVLEVRRRVGEGMDLMLDPACEYETFADALRVGRACDEARFFWYEDPFKDGGVSRFAHRKLRQMIKTPLLQGEHVRGFEQQVDFITADATDFVRADPDYDCGITGVMKIAHAAEGFGLDVEIHAPGPPHRACMAAIRNTNYYELGLVHPKVPTPRSVYLDYSDALDAVDAHGHVPVLLGPGLGGAIDWDYVQHQQVGVTVYQD
jgi:L-alanine-DL-glutamate epimerase-like enolase superfamily enzyme